MAQQEIKNQRIEEKKYENLLNNNMLDETAVETYKKLLLEKQQQLEAKMSQLVGKSKYYWDSKSKNAVLNTQIVKDMRSFESNILKMSGKWKKQYKYNICDNLVKDVMCLRSNIIDALSLDKNDAEGKMYYYNLALMCFNNIEYALDLLYTELSVITVDEMCVYAIQFDKIKYALTCLINNLKNKNK